MFVCFSPTTTTTTAFPCYSHPRIISAGINPARDLGPRLVMSVAGWGMAAFTNWWVYLLAPLVGGPIGALVADKVLME